MKSFKVTSKSLNHTIPVNLSWDTYVKRSYARVEDGSIKSSYLKVVRRFIERPVRVLDIGTGPGQYIAAIAEIEPDSQFYGADINIHFLQRASLELSTRGRKATMLACDGTCLPFPDMNFDLVMAHLSLPYAKNDRLFLNECTRVLKPSGGFWLSTHGYGFYLGRLFRDSLRMKPRWIASILCGLTSEYLGWKPLRDTPLSTVFLANKLSDAGLEIKTTCSNKFMKVSRIITVFAQKT